MAAQMDLTRTLICNQYSKNESDRNFRPQNTDIGPVRYIFRDQETELIKQISQYSSMVGCVAWLTSFPILEAMQGKRVSIVVQKEDFLRPDIGRTAQDRWKRELRQRYDALTSVANELYPWCGWGGIIQSAGSLGQGNFDAVRCVGLYNREKKPAVPRMHHKFLVFGHWSEPESDSDEYVDSQFIPQAVWTGSFNFTRNAGLSFENATVINDEQAAELYHREFQHIFLLSEPLDWEHDWVSPEYYIGS